jgi:hypothetical protein
MRSDVLLVEFHVKDSDNRLLERMQAIKQSRLESGYAHVVCRIGGFDDDPRELSRISEVKRLCRRLIDLGLIAYLDLAGALNPGAPEAARQGWGAAEVWLCAKDRLKPNLPITDKLLVELERAVAQASERAEAALEGMTEAG